MIRWTITFLVIALIAALFGFGWIAQAAAMVAKVMFCIFIFMALVLLILNILKSE